VVSLDHELEGALEIGGEKVDFTGGRGYIEKDWGKSFPSSWIWVQSNHFSDTGISFMLSLARIPWLGGSFPGFLCVLLHKGKQYRFATYTGAKVSDLKTIDGTTALTIEDNKHILEVRVHAGSPGGLKAPVNGEMSRIITESVTSIIDLNLFDKNGSTVFAGTGEYGGLEIAGDMKELE
jgi:tocopherol cyclase